MRAIILFSGGVDSTVLLALAKDAGRECHALSFDYGQRHLCELDAAKLIAAHYQIQHKILTIDSHALSLSALVSDAAVPKDRSLAEIDAGGIPSTYVPARNTLFLANATAIAEMLNADEIYFGPNALDQNPYMDCRPKFLNAFQQVLNCATKQAVEGSPPRLLTPLIDMDKTAIIRMGIELSAPLHLTFSCYDPPPNGTPCQRCDACILREEAFDRVLNSV